MGKKKKKALPPRVQRMRRPGRLMSARTWLAAFDGKNVLRGYCKHFAVDWRCAATELKMLGVALDADYLKRREVTEANRKRQLTKQQRSATSDNWHEHTDELSAYMAGDYPALYAMECERDGIDPSD